MQRARDASVVVAGRTVGRIERGLVVLVGVARDDDADDVTKLGAKLAGLRIFDDADGRMNRDVAAVGGEVLLVSQFTLQADTRSGTRPGFSPAAPPDVAEPRYEALADDLRARGLTVATGTFGAAMEVRLVNDGPVTIFLDTRERMGAPTWT